ncbi:MAG TPA: hypothetical protein VIL69_03535, partial [Roseomonas sp.]
DTIESEADRALQAGMDELFNGNVDGASPGHKLMVQMVYDGIEAVADRCEDVTDLIQAVMIEQV